MLIRHTELTPFASLHHAQTERFRMARFVFGASYPARVLGGETFLDDDFSGERSSEDAVCMLRARLGDTLRFLPDGAASYEFAYCGARETEEIAAYIRFAFQDILSRDPPRSIPGADNEPQASGETGYAFSSSASFAEMLLLPELLCDPERSYRIDFVSARFSGACEADIARFSKSSVTDEALKRAKQRVYLRYADRFDSCKIADALIELLPLSLRLSPLEAVSLCETVTLSEISDAISALRKLL